MLLKIEIFSINYLENFEYKLTSQTPKSNTDFSSYLSKADVIFLEQGQLRENSKEFLFL